MTHLRNLNPFEVWVALIAFNLFKTNKKKKSDLTKVKAVADDKLKFIQNLVRKHCGRGRKSTIFSLFLQCFLRFRLRVAKTWDCVVNSLPYIFFLWTLPKHGFVKIETICRGNINSLPNDKILDWSKFKEFSDDKINVTEKVKFVKLPEHKVLRVSYCDHAVSVFRHASSIFYHGYTTLNFSL